MINIEKVAVGSNSGDGVNKKDALSAIKDSVLKLVRKIKETKRK